MAKRYFYKGQEIGHFDFICLMSRNGFGISYRTDAEDQLKRHAAKGNEKAINLIKDIKIEL